jgi:hypothetical protein
MAHELNVIPIRAKPRIAAPVALPARIRALEVIRAQPLRFSQKKSQISLSSGARKARRFLKQHSETALPCVDFPRGQKKMGALRPSLTGLLLYLSLNVCF